jgi:tellurite resistance protein TehA-like permease
MSDKNFMRDFSPAWFASVMGTGILATTSMFYASVLPVLRYAAVILWLSNIALFLVLLFFWVMRWIRYPQNAVKDLSHPVNSQFYPTMPIALYRFIVHDPLPSQLLPTVWINLGPIGAGVMALLVMAGTSATLIQIPVSGINAFSLIFWGFGIWWFIMSLIMTFHYIGRKTLPYAMSWWAFIFPLGAYVGSSYMCSTRFMNSALLNGLGLAFTGCCFSCG